MAHIPVGERPFVLVMSHWMTPAAEVGAKRFAYLGQALERRGYDIHVVAAELSASPRLDETLPVPRRVSRISAAFRVPTGANAGWRRVAAALARRTISGVTDNEIGWVSNAAREARRLAAGRRRGVLIVTMPPYSSALAAVRVARQTGLPLVLDYRDPWTGYPWPDRFRRPVARRIARRLESMAVKLSAARVLNTPEMRDYFEASFPWADSRRNRVIRNGIDLPVEQRPEARSGPALVYAGEIYNDRSLVPVLTALRDLIRVSPQYEGMRVTMFGELSDLKRSEISAAGLDYLLDLRGVVPRQELIGVLRSARALIAVSGEQMRYSVPFKVYEYIGAGRPVLAISPAGSALHKFIEEYRVGAHLDSNMRTGGSAALRAVLEDDFDDALSSALDALSWSRMAGVYADLLDECMTDL